MNERGAEIFFLFARIHPETEKRSIRQSRRHDYEFNQYLPISQHFAHRGGDVCRVGAFVRASPQDQFVPRGISYRPADLSGLGFTRSCRYRRARFHPGSYLVGTRRVRNVLFDSDRRAMHCAQPHRVLHIYLPGKPANDELDDIARELAGTSAAMGILARSRSGFLFHSVRHTDDFCIIEEKIMGITPFFTVSANKPDKSVLSSRLRL